MIQPINIKGYDISATPLHGRFGARRKHDVHTGFDIYCDEKEPVYAIEDGIVTNVDLFTGEELGFPWWETTWAILIEGKSGVIGYCEIHQPELKIGDKVVEGQQIANIKRVLKVDKGLPMTMLHIELYKHGYRGNWEIWNLDGEKPDNLLNIEDILLKLYE